MSFLVLERGLKTVEKSAAGFIYSFSRMMLIKRIRNYTAKELVRALQRILFQTINNSTLEARQTDSLEKWRIQD